ncbi:unnamed protein product [Auanema sp. JU1783]|nr:unnamed protein product [Auanema sp. JU1783]
MFKEYSAVPVQSLNFLQNDSDDEYYDDYVYMQICQEFFCENYFTKGNIINWGILIIRVTIAVIILLLGTKMPKDFMRSVTFSIFIPIAASELLNLYRECVVFRSLFFATEEENTQFVDIFLSWTPLLGVVMNDYIHYNCIIMTILLLYCCQLCFRRGDAITPFPVNALCLILQIIPFFLCVLMAIEGEASFAIKVISVLSRLITIISFIILTIQIFFSFYLMTKYLPYDHAASVDMQLRDAKSRLAWTLLYQTIPYAALIPYFVESCVWIVVMGRTEDPAMKQTQIIMEVLKELIAYYRPTWLVVLTMTCLPPYRRAVPLLFCCGKVKVEPLPRKPVETSIMYKYAD